MTTTAPQPDPASVSPPNLLFERDGRIARIILNRPAQGNALLPGMAGELENLVERANLDPKVHVIALSGSGPGFRGGYDCAFAGSAEPVPPGGHRR